jgi:molybdopterin biosynthesis enzyme
LPYKIKSAAVITTGNEVKSGLIQDKFTPALEKKLEYYGIKISERFMPGDDNSLITSNIHTAISNGAELVLCTGGMSVDPDDKTPLAIKNSGADIITYGAPVLPGAMILMSYLNGVPVLGLPGCVMYAKRTVFDIILPRILAHDKLTRKDFIRLGEGGLCRGCDICTFPMCGFGK